MTELKTYKMGTALPLEGEVLNGGNGIDGFYYIRLSQRVHHKDHQWRRGVVLKIRRDVLSDIPFYGAEFVHHVVNPPPEDSPVCRVIADDPPLPGLRTDTDNIKKGDTLVYRGEDGQVLIGEVTRIVREGREGPLSMLHVEREGRRDNMILPDQFLGHIPWSTQIDKDLVHRKCIEALTDRIDTLETWRWDTAKMLKLLADALKKRKIPIPLFPGWYTYLTKLVKNHPGNAPKN